MVQKRCSCCKEHQPLRLFDKDKTKKDGCYSYCKMCRQNKNKQYNIDVERRRKIGRKYWLAQRKLVDGLKINGCAICGYDKCAAALNFHHVNPKDKKFLVSPITISRKDIFEELQKCILLCSNCHREIHQKEGTYDKK